MRRHLGTAAGIVALLVLTAAVIPPDRLRLERVVALAAFAFVYYRVRRGLGVGARPEAVAPALPGAGELPPPEEQDVRLARLDASLERAAGSAEQFSNVTRPMLRRLAAERLLTKSGIDVTADPSGARRLMGEELWEMFSTPGDRVVAPPGPERLRVLVDRLERL